MHGGCPWAVRLKISDSAAVNESREATETTNNDEENIVNVVSKMLNDGLSDLGKRRLMEKFHIYPRNHRPLYYYLSLYNS